MTNLEYLNKACKLFRSERIFAEKLGVRKSHIQYYRHRSVGGMPVDVAIRAAELPELKAAGITKYHLVFGDDNLFN